MIQQREIELQAIENALLRKALSGHCDSLVMLLSRYSEPLYRFSLQMVRHPTAAEWVVQQTFLSVMRELPLLSSHSNFRAWLWSLAVEKCLNHMEARGLTRCNSPRDRSQRFEDMLYSLPPGDRAAFLLHDVEGLSWDEIAWILEERAGDSKRRAHRARIALSAVVETDEQGASMSRVPEQSRAQA